jgi:hypothetical protein
VFVPGEDGTIERLEVFEGEDAEAQVAKKVK